MIWGLSPDDQPHNQVRGEGFSSHPDDPQSTPLHGTSQLPPRLQKKKTSVAQQIPKSSRTQSSHASHTKHTFARSHCQAHDDKRNTLSQVSSDIEPPQDIVCGLPWNEGHSMPINVGIPDDFVGDHDAFPVDSNRILEWQLARLRQALRTSLADMDSYTTYPGRLEPVIPVALTSGLPQSYPRIFVESRPNEPVSPPTRQSSIEMAQQYRHQQLYRQTLQKQQLQLQNILPTPPNSSSPQWSSHFSPYLTYSSAFSPESVGSTEHPVPVSSQRYRSGANAPQRHVYDRHENVNVNDFDTGTNIPSTQTILPNVHSAPSLRQSPSSSSTLAKYIKQLQALSPIAHFSPLQSLPPPNTSLSPLPSTDASAGAVYHPPAVPTPPSPESPQTLSRGPSYHNARSMVSSRSMQRRLSSVPEEDSAFLELSMSASPLRFQSQATTDNIPSGHDGTTRHHTRHVDVTRRSAFPDLCESESNLGIAFHHDTSPAKVRLPATKEHNIREQTSGYHEQSKEAHQHGHRKKHRYKKAKGSAATNEQTATRGLVG